MSLPSETPDTIAAITTPPGCGGVGVIRISGPLSKKIAQQLLGKLPLPRYATYTSFKEANGDLIDQGLLIYFNAPHSFTGEDVLELQGHGGIVVLDRLLAWVLMQDQGIRLAKPGEFSERAFLNGKIDLTQAEAIADLINAASIDSARSAARSLQGVFSQKINALVEAVIHLRMMVEAAIDFPEEEIDFLKTWDIEAKLQQLIATINNIEAEAKQGAILRDGMTLVIAGKPNVGKSSIMNRLTGQDSAIVTEIAGTTRDLLKERWQLDGIPLNLIDTAGLRETEDVVEKEGIRRARQAMENADMILLVVDVRDDEPISLPLANSTTKLTVIKNKIDLINESAGKLSHSEYTEIKLSAKSGEGLAVLRNHLKEMMGFSDTEKNIYTARKRHLVALHTAKQAIEKAHQQWLINQAGELLAEDLRQAQQALSEITGLFTTDDLLGKIFSEFCIGK